MRKQKAFRPEMLADCGLEERAVPAVAWGWFNVAPYFQPLQLNQVSRASRPQIGQAISGQIRQAFNTYTNAVLAEQASYIGGAIGGGDLIANVDALSLDLSATVANLLSTSPRAGLVLTPTLDGLLGIDMADEVFALTQDYVNGANDAAADAAYGNDLRATTNFYLNQVNRELRGFTVNPVRYNAPVVQPWAPITPFTPWAWWRR